MERGEELFRVVLLAIESHEAPVGRVTITGVDQTKVDHCTNLLYERGFIQAGQVSGFGVKPPIYHVHSLTPEGHAYLQDVR